MDVKNLNVVLTGKIAGETRQTSESKLRDAGAFVQPRVTKETNLLVTGENVGATKTNRAVELGVVVCSWSEVMNGGPPTGGPSTPRLIVRHTRKSESSSPMPRQVAPMLAQAADEPPEGDDWQFEIKWDGYRCIAYVQDGEVTLRSRSGKPLLFPQIEEALAPLSGCVFDGEAVVFDETGLSSLQSIGSGHTGAVYVLFDLLELGGVDLRRRPWAERREMLERLFEMIAARAENWVQLSPLFEDGDQLLAHAREAGQEGIVAKRVNSTYQEGSRGEAWRKIKVRQEQEFVVIGWTEGENGNTGHLGALALGYFENAKLMYAGKVGTGWSEAEGDELLAEVTAAGGTAEPPENLGPSYTDRALARDVHWVEPRVVIQVQYQRWTPDGRLWHPSFKGQRNEKAPEDVRKESS